MSSVFLRTANCAICIGLSVVLAGCASDQARDIDPGKDFAVLSEPGTASIDLVEASAGIARPHLALVIAETYVDSNTKSGSRWRALTSTTADAGAIEASLRLRNFELVGGGVQKNVSRHELLRLLDLARSMTISRPGAVLLVYFSGHGFAQGGHDYLVPNDAPESSPTDAAASGLPLTQLFEHLQRKDKGANILLIDACRSVSIKGDTLGAFVEEKGLPARTFVGYATTYGETVSAGNADAPSDYAKAWADEFRRAGPLATLASMHYEVAQEVVGRTWYQQRPVFSRGPDLPAEDVLFLSGELERTARSPSGSPLRGTSGAMRELLDTCVAPLFNGSDRSVHPSHSDKSTDAPAENTNSQVELCTRQLAARKPEVAEYLHKLQGGPDMIAAIVAQAAQEGDSFALLLIGLSDLTDSSQLKLAPLTARGASDPPIGHNGRKSLASAWDNIIRAARLGNAYAAFLAGEALIFGPYTGHSERYPKPNREVGVALLDQAQRGGLGEAAAWLAMGYDSGVGLDRNPLLARKYARLMIHEGLHGSFPADLVSLMPYVIGADCSSGRYAPKDGECATELLTWVADTATGASVSGRSLAGLAAVRLVQMHEPRVAGAVIVNLGQNDPLSRFYVERAVQEGDVDGEDYLGRFLEYGQHGYPRDPRLAVYWYRLSAAKGNAPAAGALRRLGLK
jgi:TPR repeat protein